MKKKDSQWAVWPSDDPVGQESYNHIERERAERVQQDRLSAREEVAIQQGERQAQSDHSLRDVDAVAGALVRERRRGHATTAAGIE